MTLFIFAALLTCCKKFSKVPLLIYSGTSFYNNRCFVIFYFYIHILYRNFTLYRGSYNWLVINFSFRLNKLFIFWKLYVRAWIFWIFKNVVFKFSIRVTVIFFVFRFTRSSRSQMFFKTGLLKNIAIFTVRVFFCWSLFPIMWKAWRPVTLLKRDSNTGVF